MATSTLRLARPVRAEVVRHMRRHDLVFYAAGLTFYAAIAVVPLLLVAWFVTSLVLGDDLVRTLTLALAEYAPTSLGLQEGVRSLGEVGPRLGIASFAAALIPATSYGDGLVRALDRIAERDRRAKGLRGRLLGLVFVAALPPVVMGELARWRCCPKPSASPGGSTWSAWPWPSWSGGCRRGCWWGCSTGRSRPGRSRPGRSSWGRASPARSCPGCR
jgi:hypothetical protein